MNRQRPTKGVLYMRNIPDSIKAHFKATCARRGDSMQTVVKKLMELYVKKPSIIEDK